MTDISGPLASTFGARARPNVTLASFTTFRVGGPADWLVETRSAGEIVTLLCVAREALIPFTVLGGGSNVVVADAGIRGIVAITRGGSIAQVSDDAIGADASVTINGLVRWTVGRGLAGLEAWAGTPGTIGGGIYGNAHFQGRLLSEHVRRVRLLSPDGSVSDVAVQDMGFGYDVSRIQATREIVLSAEFRVGRGEPEALRGIARASLAYRKRTQPLHMPSAGCIFQNPSPADALPAGVPCSAGALIDLAGLKGASCGGARVSPLHGNFIVNEGTATAGDIRALVNRCRDAVAAKFGVLLREEIVYVGDWGPDSRP